MLSSGSITTSITTKRTPPGNYQQPCRQDGRQAGTGKVKHPTGHLAPCALRHATGDGMMELETSRRLLTLIRGGRLLRSHPPGGA